MRNVLIISLALTAMVFTSTVAATPSHAAATRFFGVEMSSSGGPTCELGNAFDWYLSLPVSFLTLLYTESDGGSTLTFNATELDAEDPCPDFLELVFELPVPTWGERASFTRVSDDGCMIERTFVDLRDFVDTPTVAGGLVEYTATDACRDTWEHTRVGFDAYHV